MKFLFFVLVVLVVVWAIKRGRAGTAAPKASQAPTPTEMVACAHCGIHLPRAEAVSGHKGQYCSTEHRSAAQDHNPV
ncbi:MAG: hypothetical protein RLZZ464_2293 [Pseudomonadota bacterium]|jgi:uncharacterized protein